VNSTSVLVVLCIWWEYCCTFSISS